MYLTRLKLFLALLWLLPGLGFVAWDAAAGQSHGLPLGPLRVPVGWLFLLFAVFNLVRWWAARPERARPSPFAERRLRQTRRHAEAEPDPAFRFDDPPTPSPSNEER
jgi:hypothetical protein